MTNKAAEKTALSAHTLRYYERIARPGRAEGETTCSNTLPECAWT